jgi:hypothetical protein
MQADAPPLGEGNRGPSIKSTAGVLGLALLLRTLVVVVWVRQHGAALLFQRGIEMDLLARSLLLGHGLASPFGGSTGSTAFIAPAYPILVAAAYRVFGVATSASACVIMGMQIAAGLATIWLLMHVARACFGERAAMLAGLFWAVSPPLLFLPTIFWETSLSICLLMGLIALALKVHKQPTAWLMAGLGAYCGLGALVNPALLLSAGAIAAVACWRRTTLRNAVLAGAAFAAVFCAWPIRNAMVFHAFVPLRTTVGFELWMGNHPGSRGFLDESLFPMFNSHELNLYLQQGEIAYTDGKAALALRFIEAQPRTFAALTLRRVVRFWTGTGTKGGSSFLALHATVSTCFGLCGLLLLLRRRRGWLALLLGVPLLLFPLPYYITHAEFRYRMVIDPVVTLLGAYAVTEFLRSKRMLN